MVSSVWWYRSTFSWHMRGTSMSSIFLFSHFISLCLALALFFFLISYLIINNTCIFEVERQIWQWRHTLFKIRKTTYFYNPRKSFNDVRTDVRNKYYKWLIFVDPLLLLHGTGSLTQMNRISFTHLISDIVLTSNKWYHKYRQNRSCNLVSLKYGG